MQEQSYNGLDPIPMEKLPKYDLFLSQVIEFLNENFPDERFTGNIVQNYIKNEVITKPIHGKKRGYTRMHLIQLIFLSYMRAILTADEIKSVFSLAFNEINQPEDDILSWEQAYEIFCQIYQTRQIGGASWEDSKIRGTLEELDVAEEDFARIRDFIKVLILITRAANIKREVREIVANAVQALEA